MFGVRGTGGEGKGASRRGTLNPSVKTRGSGLKAENATLALKKEGFMKALSSEGRGKNYVGLLRLPEKGEVGPQGHGGEKMEGQALTKKERNKKRKLGTRNSRTGTITHGKKAGVLDAMSKRGEQGVR